MSGSIQMNRWHRHFVAVMAVLVMTTSAVAQNTPSDATPPPQRKYPNIPVEPEVFRSPDEWFKKVSRKIEDGTAKTQERRAWYELKKRYYPFTPDALPAPNWRAAAVAKGDLLDPRLNPGKAGNRLQAVTDYTWTQFGPTVDWCQGQPPSAGCPDQGAGRATAIWANPNDKRDVLIGYADGGVWKSSNVTNVANSASWTPIFDFQPSLAIGSIAARVSALDSNRLGPNTTIWVATGEGNFGGGSVEGVGVLKSTDGGATWSLKQIPWVVAADGTTMFARTSVRRIALDPRNANHLWLAADSGVYRSVDAGETWALVTALPYYKKFTGDCWDVYWTDLIIDDQTPAAGQPSHIYAAGPRPFDAGCSAIARQDAGVYRSVDGGATWVNISTPAGSCPGTVAGTTSRGYSCAGTGFAASGLASATALTTGHSIGRISLMHSAVNKKKIYAQLHSTVSDGSLGIWSTADASAASVAWTARATTNYCGTQCWYDMVGAVDPTNDAKLYVGGLDGYTSADSAATLFKTTAWTGWGGANYAHADHHHVIWVDPTTVYLVADGGFHVGTVTGPLNTLNDITFVTQNNGVGTGTLQAYGMGQSAAAANRIHVGVQDNGQPKVVLDASGNVTQWWEIRGGDGGFSATDRGNDAITYNEYVYGSIYRATNASYTTTTAWNWACIAPLGGCATNTCNGACNPDNSTQFIAPFMLDRNNQSLLYFGSRRVHRRDNTAGTWLVYSPDLTTVNNATSILWVHSAFNNGVAGTLYATTENGRVWKTTNATCNTASCATWTNLTKAPLPNRAATWVETDPTNANRAIVTFSGFNTGHVFRTTDGGTTWVDISAELPNEPFNAVAIDPSNPNRIYVGSDFGVYINEDGWNGTTWMRINNGALPYQKIYQLEFSPAAGGKLRAATHGRGIWEMTVAAGAGCGGSVPLAPTGVTTSVTGGQVVVSWAPVTGATKYTVYRYSGSGCPAPNTGTIVGSGITGTSFTDAAACGNTYSYFVTATNASNCEGAKSACTSATVTAPTAPVVSTTPGSGQVSLSWTAAAGASTYEIWRKNAATCPAADNGTMIASGVAALSYVDTGLTNGTSYVYSVRGTSSCIGPFSVCVAAQPTACTPPAAPATVTAVASAVREVSLTWTAVAGAASYKVYRAGGSCTAANSSYTLIASGIAGTSYVDVNDGGSPVADNTRYSYKVVTTGTCDSALSTACAWAEAYGDCVIAPTFAGATAATATAGASCQTDLTWAAASSNCGGTVSYSVYRSTLASFVPTAATRIASGISGTSFADTNGLNAGVTYYYIVRAVDSRNEVEDTNIIRRSAVAGAACMTAPLDVQAFTVTASGTATAGQNVLQWWNPPSGAPGTTLTINYKSNAAGACTFPTGPADGTATVLVANRPVTFGAVDSFAHSGLTNGTSYCYAIWVKY